MKAHWELDADCPIKADLEAAVSIGEQLMTIIQRLQQDLEGCELCSDWENCQIFQSLNPMIDEVILEINEEWGLDI